MKIITKDKNGLVIKVQTDNQEPSKTQQQFKDSSNINNIMKKYHATGMITHLNQKQGSYADLSKVKDYQSSLQTVIDAQQAFMTLSSDVRKKFSNDPQELIGFLADPKNRDEAESLNLITKKPKTETQPNPNTTPISTPTKP